MYSWEVKPLAEKHTKFIMGLLHTTGGITYETCEYLCTEVFLHAWKHCEEEMSPAHGADGKFIKKNR